MGRDDNRDAETAYPFQDFVCTDGMKINACLLYTSDAADDLA